jgi:hypothetical protein
MSRLLRLAVSQITIVGYFLAVTWGPAWHDHHHCHSGGAEPADCVAGHSHPHCCSHHHHHHPCGQETQPLAESGHSPGPCHSPWHDDGCVVCQTLAHPPLAPSAIQLVDASEPVREWVSPIAPLAEFTVAPAYDSRGPPLV